MGARLVTKVLMNWTHVSDRAFRLLIRMAHTALDRPQDDKPAKVYFGGRDLLAMTLRTDKGSDRSRYRTVALVLAELVEAGAIERIGGGRTGHNATFRMTLDRTSQDGEFSHPQDGQISHPQDGEFSPARVADLATPRKNEEEVEELLEERRGDVQTAAHPPREPEEPPEPEIAPVLEIRPGASQEAPYVAPPKPKSFAQQNVNAASARRRAAVAAHRKAQGAT